MKTLKLNFGDEFPDNYTGIVELCSGTKEWWIEGKLHRIDGPAIIYPNGSKHWYKKGELHREDGPAIESANGTKEWWINGNLHREDGPAIEWGENVISCYIDEFVYTEEILESLIKESIFLGIEKGKYGLEWIKLLTENGGICEIPNFRKLKESDIKKGIT